MKLVESYLIEIGRYLPKTQREDILIELRSTIEEQILDISAGLAPSLENQKTILNQFGHPMRVASEYQEQRYLIGPGLYPAFVETAKTVYSILFPVMIAVFALSWVTVEPNATVRVLVGGVFQAAFWAIIIIIGVFAALEYSGERSGGYDSWTADALRPSNRATIDRSDLVTNLIAEGVFLLWWNKLLVLKDWFPWFGESYSITLSPAWDVLFWPLNILVGAWFLTHVFVLFSGAWSTSMLRTEIVFGTAALAITGWLMTQLPLVEVTGDIGDNGDMIVNRSMLSVVVFIAGLTLWDIYLAVKRLKTGSA